MLLLSRYALLSLFGTILALSEPFLYVFWPFRTRRRRLTSHFPQCQSSDGNASPIHDFSTHLDPFSSLLRHDL
jgi:hypothetical protein